jgi:hypothetical protein
VGAAMGTSERISVGVAACAVLDAAVDEVMSAVVGVVVGAFSESLSGCTSMSSGGYSSRCRIGDLPLLWQ